MARFIDTLEQNNVIAGIFESAEKEIKIISPFIQLSPHFQEILQRKIENEKVKITIVFGKNEENLYYSLNMSDLEFFCKFPNVEIKYQSRLHAKYYGNESEGLSTSMNLHMYSHNNNIEIGIHLEKNHLLALNEKLGSSKIPLENLFSQANRLVDNIIKGADTLFIKVPKYSSTLLGITKKYTGSEIIIDKREDFFHITPEDYREAISIEHPGAFCIRCKTSIPLNSTKPFCLDCYHIWKMYKNIEYREKFCHLCGESKSTSFRWPICSSCDQEYLDMERNAL